MATGNPTVPPGTLAKSMNAANKGQISESLIIQAYANSVEQQPQVDFGNVPSMKSYQTNVNDGLAIAKAHASNYLTVVQPEIIKNLTNSRNYYAIHSSVATTLLPNATLEEWSKALHLLQNKVETYQRDAKGTTNSLKTLHDAMYQDMSAFADIVRELNAAVGGDHVVLNSINGQLSSIQGKIDGAIAAVVLTGLSTIGGVFMICVGAIDDFVTAGTTTPLVVGGIGMVVGGVGGTIPSAIAIANLNNKKASLLTEEIKLKNEVKIATGIQIGYTSFLNKVKDAVNSSLETELAWQKLAEDLGTMISDLNNGLMTAEQIRKLFLTEGNHDAQTVIKDVNRIKALLAGVTEIVAKKGHTVSQLIIATAEGNQEPNPTMLMAQITPRMKAISQSTPASVAKTVNAANKQQTSLALIIQNYANSVNEQPMVNFSYEQNLIHNEKGINNGLKTAQDHANNYLNVIQPLILENISNIGNYYTLHASAATIVPKGATNEECLEVLQVLADEAKRYKKDSNGIVKQLQTLYENLTSDSNTFKNMVLRLNAAVKGNKGILNSISNQLSKIQSKIDGAIAGTTLSALAIVDGGFMVAVGSIGRFVTAETSTAMPIDGVAIISTGIGCEVASAVLLESFFNEKVGLLANTAELKAEVRLAIGISSSYDSLKTQIGNAVTAASSMQNAWELLSADLANLISDLEKGIISKFEIWRKMFGATAINQIKTAITDINTIKRQMAGVDNIPVTRGETVGQAIVAAAKATQSSHSLQTCFSKLLQE